MFCMTKPVLFSLNELLKLLGQKQDTKYRLVVPLVVYVACNIFKLTHNATLLICNKLIVIDWSTILLMLREVVQAINVTLWSEISWPTGDKLMGTEASLICVAFLEWKLRSHWRYTNPYFKTETLSC